MNDQPEVRVFDPPNTQPRGRRPEQPARVETFGGSQLEGMHGPELLELPDGGEVAPETRPPRKRTGRKAGP